jgi:hypothetical protein
MTTVRIRLLLLAVAVLGVGPLPLRAQLISPGKLSQPHAELDGVRQCTACHELRKRGVSAPRCLQCHELLRTRIEAGHGYHASVRDRNCGECHKEHFGREFALVRLDTASFDHAATGFALRGAHLGVFCSACHAPALIKAADVLAHPGGAAFLGRTMLGLPTACAGCHAGDDPHGAQFRGRACEDCHGEADWGWAERFDHDRAAFRLTGRHLQVSCESCHEAERAGGATRVRYVGIPFASCSSCHRDPHAGSMGAQCSGCHAPDGWDRVPWEAVAARFDHSGTRFPLNGRHAAVVCAGCHGKPAPRTPTIAIRFVPGTEEATFPRPLAGECAACHVDHHRGELRGSRSGAACEGCHTEHGWTPVMFDIARHQQTEFPLTGAHATTPCSACHVSTGQRGPTLRLRLPDRECVACHRADDPHKGSFGARSCATCHTTETFRVRDFDHALARGAPCRSCHRPDDPHGGQFQDVDCAACHATETFRIAAFDHGRGRFPLTGAHLRVECAACHPSERRPDGGTMVRYRPLGIECTDCHGGGP